MVFPENINKFIESRTTHDGDGMKISEWHTDLNSVLDFIIVLTTETELTTEPGAFCQALLEVPVSALDH